MFYGIDISPKAVIRAKENLASLPNVSIVCDDYLIHEFDRQFNVIYSSLTFMHIKDKLTAINKIAGLLSDNGRFVLSTDKNRDEYIVMHDRKVKIYPDNHEEIRGYIKAARLKLEKHFETEFAHIFVAEKIDCTKYLP
jgi:SAM-dependent methyltransferase